MSDSPNGFDYETLITYEDLVLRKFALTPYPDDAADDITEKYTIADNWQSYDDKGRNLISHKSPKEEFIKGIEKLNSKTLRIYL